MKEGAVFRAFLGEIKKVVAQAKETKVLEELAESLETAVNRLGGVAMYMGQTAFSPKFKVAFSHALLKRKCVPKNNTNIFCYIRFLARFCIFDLDADCLRTD